MLLRLLAEEEAKLTVLEKIRREVDRWLEIPAWMFRAVGLGPGCVWLLMPMPIWRRSWRSWRLRSWCRMR
jgi:hypothetical protein